jgi:glycosyltransferase involved in cell wall biosynthesis
VADDLAQVGGIPRERITVIQNPVVTPSVKEKSLQYLDHPWFSPGQPPVVLAVGRLAPQKDYPTLLHAFAKVHRTRPVRLIILGEGDARGELEMLPEPHSGGCSAPGLQNPCPYMKNPVLCFRLDSRACLVC